MKHSTITVVDGKHPITLQVKRMVIYLQSKIIEAYNEHGEVYYCFFYKNDFLNVKKCTKLRLHSHMQKAFQNGQLYEAPHPLIDLILPTNRTLKSITFKQLFSKLETKYPPVEIARIATFFESFIPQKALLKLIQTKYYEYVRDGKMLKSYQVIRVLLNFAPKDKWVKEFANKLEYYQYATLYKQLDSRLFTKDMIFAESEWFTNMKEEENLRQLLTYYEKENLKADIISTHIHAFLMEPTNEQFHTLLKSLHEIFSEQEIVMILDDINQKHSNFSPIHHFLLNFYMENNELESAIQLISSYPITFTHSQLKKLAIVMESIHLEETAVSPHDWHHILIPIYDSNHQQLDKILHRYVGILLESYDLPFVTEWLEPFQQLNLHLPIIAKVKKMGMLRNDPDQQSLLGEMYYQFHLTERAIECFSWEMELKENDPRPVQWLAKIYREAGQMHEYKAYQQHYMNLQNGAS